MEGPEILRFSQVPRWRWSCWGVDYTLGRLCRQYCLQKTSEAIFSWVMILEPASLILPELMENASLSFFGEESLFMSTVYLYFSKDEVYPQSIKPIYRLLKATHLFLRFVLTLLVVKPWVQTCFRKEIHLVRGSWVLTSQITFCSCWIDEERHRDSDLTIFHSLNEVYLLNYMSCVKRGRRAMVLETKTEFLSFNTGENASGYYYLWFMGCIAIWPVSLHSRQRTLTLCLWWTLVLPRGNFPL